MIKNYKICLENAEVEGRTEPKPKKERGRGRTGLKIESGRKHKKLVYEQSDGQTRSFPFTNPHTANGGHFTFILKRVLKMLGIPLEDFAKALN